MVPLNSDLPLARQALSMRYRGYEVEDIAHALSSSPKAIQSVLDRACSAQADQERVALVREAELNKLDEIEQVYLDDAVTGNHKSAYLVLKMMERRSALIGLDKAPPAQFGNSFTLVQILAGMRPQSAMPIVDLQAAE